MTVHVDRGARALGRYLLGGGEPVDAVVGHLRAQARVVLEAALDVDEIAQAIRVAGGSHELAAGALAEVVRAHVLGDDS